MTDDLDTTGASASAQDDARDTDLTGALSDAVRGLFAVGRLWAAHGLGVGRSALEASAGTLRTTADLLGELSERFERDRDAA